MWSHTNLSASHTAWRSARTWSVDPEWCAMENFSPHWWHTTVVMTTVLAGSSVFLLRNRLAVPCGLGRSAAGSFTTATLAGRGRSRGPIRRGDRGLPWAVPR